MDDLIRLSPYPLTVCCFHRKRMSSSVSPSLTGERSVLGGPELWLYGHSGFFAAYHYISILMMHHVTHMSVYGNVSLRCVSLCLYLPSAYCAKLRVPSMHKQISQRTASSFRERPIERFLNIRHYGIVLRRVGQMRRSAWCARSREHFTWILPRRSRSDPTSRTIPRRSPFQHLPFTSAASRMEGKGYT